MGLQSYSFHDPARASTYGYPRHLGGLGEVWDPPRKPLDGIDIADIPIGALMPGTPPMPGRLAGLPASRFQIRPRYVYRVVGKREHQSLLQLRKFTPSPSYEHEKAFWTSKRDAVRYWNINQKAGWHTEAVWRAKLPDGVGHPGVEMDNMATWMIPNTNLDNLTRTRQVKKF